MFKLRGDIHPLLFKDLVKKGFKGVVKYSKGIYIVEIQNDEGHYIDSYRVDSSYGMDGIYNDMEVMVLIDGAFLKAFTIEEYNIMKAKENRLLEERQKRELEYKKEVEERIKREKEDEKRYIEECKTFYENLKLNVKYTPVYRVVNSGLRSGSMGNGVYKNTVIHLRLDEDFTDGKRFYRKSGESLCKCNLKGRLGIEEEVAGFVDNNSNTRHKISCKACLKILNSKGLIKE